VLFESAADVYGHELVGIVMTGANHDGAQGLLRIRQRRGIAIVQEPLDAEASAMPQAALDLAGADHCVPLRGIAPSQPFVRTMKTVLGHRPKILIADDHRPNLVAIRRILTGIDADLVEATTGNEVLAATLDHEFALILLDVQMPDMNGFETASLLAGEERTRSTPVIFVTASHADDVNRLRGYSFGAVDYITKPLNDVILLSKVRVFLDLYRSKSALRNALSDLSERNRQLEREIAERRAAEEQVRHLAHHDVLTGIGNRLLFITRLEAAIARARATDSRFALAYLDIDGFKPINDNHGHAAGDQLLKLIANRLRANLRYEEATARFGGDEFAVILDINDAMAIERRVEEIATAVLEPYDIYSPITGAHVKVDISGSIGVALFPRDGTDSEAMIHAADSAMYAAKRNGGGVQFFNASEAQAAP
jgi:diguanylate cyclase (GGDEF)-like protein